MIKHCMELIIEDNIVNNVNNIDERNSLKKLDNNIQFFEKNYGHLKT